MAVPTAKRALHYLVFKGTVREGNLGTRVVTFLKKVIEERGNKATVIGKIEHAEGTNNVLLCCRSRSVRLAAS